MNKQQSNNLLSIGFLVSYDYEYLKYSLPLVYDYVDSIILAIDLDRISLTGQKYPFDEEFKKWVQAIDSSKKILWLEYPFFKRDKSPFEIIMQMRTKMLSVMPLSRWYIQLDCDEYFLDFNGFAEYLKSLPVTDELQVIQCKWKTLFKQTENGFLVIGGKAETVPIAINQPSNTSERMHEDAKTEDAPYYILHQSWARSYDEIRRKIENWSHSQDFDTKAFFVFWSMCNKKNYRRMRHFHPLHPPIWPYLEWVPAHSIRELIAFYRNSPPKEAPTPTLPWQAKLIRKVKKYFS